MRLIDADALIEDVKTLWDYKTVDGITSSAVLKQIVTDIQNAPTIPAPRWEGVEDGVYAVKDGVVYKMEVKTPEGKTVKLPRIRLTDAMRYEPPKEE